MARTRSTPPPSTPEGLQVSAAALVPAFQEPGVHVVVEAADTARSPISGWLRSFSMSRCRVRRWSADAPNRTQEASAPLALPGSSR